MQNLSTILTSLSVAAGLALGVERTLEVLKHIMESESGFLRRNEYKDAVGRTEHAVEKAKTALTDVTSGNIPLSPPHETEPADPKSPAGDSPTHEIDTDPSPTDSESAEQFPAPPIPVIPATPKSPFAVTRTLFLQLAAAGLGMILAYIFKLRLLTIFLEGYGFATTDLFSALDIVFTGLMIGGGSQPIHLLIRFLTERKVTVGTEEAAKPQPPVPKTVATTELVETATGILEPVWKDIDYRGGVHPERLEKAHRRPGNPSLIVYHHTAMAATNSFQDIVDEFLINKKWLTGYHCVIMPDGAIRPFCRWDRYGNHAKGKNARSLGIAIHGNFHTEPTDKYSNADGRYGNQEPTAAQLHAGARVVALWVYLYADIALDFNKSILPHREAIPKHTVCPGSNFPFSEFQRLIRYYYEAWAEPKIAQEGIAAFQRLPKIYAT